MFGKTQKVLESQIHETLYKNISTLTFFYPPHKDFHDVFKKDMFVKNNKGAFNHVTYYLLHVLDPVLIKSKISSWPILDFNYERQFRNEVTKYLNELNDTYKNANLPNIMGSQLVSPGGHRFAKYMLKLSMLVLHEVSIKNIDTSNNILSKPNLSKDANIAEKQIKNLTKLTVQINKQTQRLRLKFHEKALKLREEADNIIKQLEEVQSIIPVLQIKIQKLEVSSCEYENKTSLLKSDLSKLTLRCKRLTTIKEKLVDISESNITLPTASDEELNLTTLFEKFNLEMANLCVEMELYTEAELNCYIKKFTKCKEDLVWLKNNMDTIHKKWLKLSDDIQNSSSNLKNRNVQNKNLFPVPLSIDDCTILAVPLDASQSM